MVIQNKSNLNYTREISKEDWKKLGSKQKLYNVLDSKESAALKEQKISNSIGIKPGEKPGEKKLEPKKDADEKKA